MKTEINKQAFEVLLERETKLRNDSPEHTLDWYTYDNKVRLLNEVAALFIEKPKTAAEVIKVIDDDLEDLEAALAKKAKAKTAKAKSKEVTTNEEDSATSKSE